MCGLVGVGFAAQFVPVGFGDFDSVVFGCGLDVGEGLISFVVGGVLDLVEACDGVADVRGVVEWLFTFVWEGVGRGGEFVALFRVEGVVVFVMFPGGFHWRAPISDEYCAGVRATSD